MCSTFFWQHQQQQADRDILIFPSTTKTVPTDEVTAGDATKKCPGPTRDNDDDAKQVKKEADSAAAEDKKKDDSLRSKKDGNGAKKEDDSSVEEVTKKVETTKKDASKEVVRWGHYG